MTTYEAEDQVDEDAHLTDDLDVQMINRTRNTAILTCNCHVPVTHWFGTNGLDCGPFEAVTCVCGDEAHGWFTLDLVEFDYVTVH